MGHWYSIKPSNLSRQDARHGWVFANYSEGPWENAEHRSYYALYFRNRERTCFGVKLFDDSVHQDTVRRIAARVVQDKEYRESLISDDPELPLCWKRR